METGGTAPPPHPQSVFSNNPNSATGGGGGAAAVASANGGSGGSGDVSSTYTSANVGGGTTDAVMTPLAVSTQHISPGPSPFAAAAAISTAAVAVVGNTHTFIQMHKLALTHTPQSLFINPNPILNLSQPNLQPSNIPSPYHTVSLPHHISLLM